MRYGKKGYIFTLDLEGLMSATPAPIFSREKIEEKWDLISEVMQTGNYIANEIMGRIHDDPNYFPSEVILDSECHREQDNMLGYIGKWFTVQFAEIMSGRKFNAKRERAKLRKVWADSRERYLEWRKEQDESRERFKKEGFFEADEWR